MPLCLCWTLLETHYLDTCNFFLLESWQALPPALPIRSTLLSKQSLSTHTPLGKLQVQQKGKSVPSWAIQGMQAALGEAGICFAKCGCFHVSKRSKSGEKHLHLSFYFCLRWTAAEPPIAVLITLPLITRPSSALPQQPLDHLSGCTEHFILDLHMAMDSLLDWQNPLLPPSPLLIKPFNSAPSILNLGREDKTWRMGAGTQRSLETRTFHSLFTEVKCRKAVILLFLLGI